MHFDQKYNESELKVNPEEKHASALPLTSNNMVNSRTPWCYQFNLLARRNFLNLMRLPQTSYVKLITTCVTAIFAALLFWQAGALIEDTISPKAKITYNQAFQNL